MLVLLKKSIIKNQNPIMKKSIYILICFALCVFSKTGSGQERMIYLKGIAPSSIYSSNLDGSNEIFITSGVSNPGRGGFNGGKIYYISGSSIHKINMDGTGHAVIPNTNDAYGEIHVSPSGDKIVYCGGLNNYYLNIIDTNGTNKILFNDGQPGSIHQTGPSWNSAGTIYFVQSNYGNAYSQKIYSKPDNDPSAVPLLLTTSFAQEPNSGGPNNLILYNNLSGDLITMNPDGSNQTILSSAGGGNYAKGAWHLSDSTFYYMQNYNIFKIKYNNTGNAQITSTAGIERVIGFGTVGPVVTITVSSNPVCLGTTVTFTASTVNGGANPQYQWKVNGINAGTNNPLFTYSPVNNDAITCIYTSNAPGNPVTSNSITMIVHPLPFNFGQSTTNINQGLVAYYPFNGNANDESGNGNNGTVNGATLTADRFGNANSAYTFDGINDVISTPVSNGFTNEISLCAWYKADGSQNNMSGIISSRSGYYQLNGLGVQNTTIGFWLVNIGGGLGYSTPLDNQWHFIAGTYKNGVIKLFYDNQLVASRNQNVNFIVDQPFEIGYDNYSGADRHFFGSLDEIQIYNRGLSDAEVNSLYSCNALSAQLASDTICSYNSTSLNLFNSQPGIKYQMLKSGVNYGNYQFGNGNTITFPINGLIQTSSFTVNATDTTTGCNITLDSTFTVYLSSVNAVVSPNTAICSGNSATLTASGGTSYLWSNGGTTSTITVSPTVTTTYYVTVSNATGCSDMDSVKVTVYLLPVPTISGPVTACTGATGNVYTTQPGMSNYTWIVSSGGTIMAGAGTNAITVTWNTSGAKTVSVNYVNANGCTAASPVVYNVTVNPLPVPAITGPNASCAGSTNNIYTTETGMSNYTWVVSAGGLITSGGGTNSINVSWSNIGLQTVSVSYTNGNGCTSSVPSVYNVTVSPMPAPTITGYNNMCVNSSDIFYSTEPGMSGYQWNVSSGGTITFGVGTYQVQVTWNFPGTHWISVNYTNPNGCTAPSPTVFNVTINPLPDPAGSITGTSAVCAGVQGVSYYTTPIANTSYYVWILPAGASIVSGSGTNSITVDFSASAISGEITVYGNNLCGNGTISQPFPVTVVPFPAAPGIVSGPSNVCKPATGIIFSVEPVNGATGYTWTLPPSSILVAGGNTNSVTVDFPIESYSGIVSVVATNSCGDSPPSPNLVVTVTAFPAAPLIFERNDTLFSSLGYGNQWYRNDSLITGAVMYYYLPDQSGEYWDIVSTENCFSDTSNHIFVVMSGVVSLQSAVCSVYPVPNDGMFVISMNSYKKEIFDIIIYNNLGQNIFEIRDIEVAGTFEKQIDLRPVPSGVYSLVLSSSDSKIVKKIIVKM